MAGNLLLMIAHGKGGFGIVNVITVKRNYFGTTMPVKQVFGQLRTWLLGKFNLTCIHQTGCVILSL